MRRKRAFVCVSTLPRDAVCTGGVAAASDAGHSAAMIVATKPTMIAFASVDGTSSSVSART